MTLDELKQAEQEAYSAWSNADSMLRNAIRKEEDEARRRIQEAHAEEKVRVDELYRAKNEAKRAREVGEVEAAHTKTFKLNNGLELKAGDRVYRTVASTWKRESSLRRGVVEIADHQSKFPANRNSGLPRPGEVFVRLLKSNGEAGTQYETLAPYAPWRLEVK